MAGLRGPVRLALAGAGMLLLGACATEDNSLRSAAEMYSDAQVLQDSANYDAAERVYNDIQANYPFGTHAQQSLLNLVHMHYENRKYDNAVASAEKFINDYPTHTDLDYVRFVRALSFQREQTGLLDQIILADSGNNSRVLQVRAYEAFAEIIELHPDSKYAIASSARIAEIIHHLAEDELLTAIHYMRIGAYGAAVRRTGQMVLSYPESHVLERALAVMVASLVEMNAGITLNDAVTSLEESFPDSHYLEPARAGAASLMAFMEVTPVPGDLFTSLIDDHGEDS